MHNASQCRDFLAPGRRSSACMFPPTASCWLTQASVQISERPPPRKPPQRTLRNSMEMSKNAGCWHHPQEPQQAQPLIHLSNNPAALHLLTSAEPEAILATRSPQPPLLVPSTGLRPKYVILPKNSPNLGGLSATERGTCGAGGPQCGSTLHEPWEKFDPCSHADIRRLFSNQPNRKQ